MKKDIKVRIAPSPTGFMHIGTARTALFNVLFAKKNGGAFVLRIEDTDKERSKKEFEEDIVAGLKWLGFEWDEFYRQSERGGIYKKYIEKLLAEGKAFWCLHTPEELKKESEEQYAKKEAPRHICGHKSNKEEDISNKGGIIRLNVPQGEKIVFNDLIRGEVAFKSSLLGDFSIAKNLDEPLYHFAVVVDDHESAISHIIRGDDHLANTPKHILIQRALGFETPEYAHLPMILAPDRSKLSKRHDAVSVSEYKKQGYLPEAIVNYLGLLGFTPEGDREIFSVEKLTELFDFKKLHKSGAIFDIKKLDWLNGEYIKKLGEKDFIEKLSEFLPNGAGDSKILEKAVPMFKERIKKFGDIKEFNFLLGEPEYETGLLKWRKSNQKEAAETLKAVKAVIEKEGVEDKNGLRSAVEAICDKYGGKGPVFWPFRVALTGQEFSPDPVEVAYVLGKKETLNRIDGAIKKIESK